MVKKVAAKDSVSCHCLPHSSGVIFFSSKKCGGRFNTLVILVAFCGLFRSQRRDKMRARRHCWSGREVRPGWCGLPGTDPTRVLGAVCRSWGVDRSVGSQVSWCRAGEIRLDCLKIKKWKWHLDNQSIKQTNWSVNRWWINNQSIN